MDTKTQLPSVEFKPISHTKLAHVPPQLIKNSQEYWSIHLTWDWFNPPTGQLSITELEQATTIRFFQSDTLFSIVRVFRNGGVTIQLEPSKALEQAVVAYRQIVEEQLEKKIFHVSKIGHIALLHSSMTLDHLNVGEYYLRMKGKWFNGTKAPYRYKELEEATHIQLGSTDPFRILQVHRKNGMMIIVEDQSRLVSTVTTLQQQAGLLYAPNKNIGD